jgi:hypothetical protein
MLPEGAIMSCKHPALRHHHDAAHHYEKAAHHHREAERLFALENPVAAAYHAHLASGHCHQGDYYATEASKEHVRINGT